VSDIPALQHALDQQIASRQLHKYLNACVKTGYFSRNGNKLSLTLLFAPVEGKWYEMSKKSQN
jgi:hypothetical protein